MVRELAFSVMIVMKLKEFEVGCSTTMDGDSEELMLIR